MATDGAALRGAASLGIIMPAFNNGPLIVEALADVVGHPSISEIVVADGGSTDDTVEQLDRMVGVQVLPGPDQGIYDALDKALRASTADYLIHLNADDRLAGDVLADLIVLATNEWPDVVSCRAELFETSDGRERVIQTYDAQTSELDLYDITRGTPAINARVLRREFLVAVGGYDPRYRVAGDREVLLRMFLANPRVASLDRVLYRYRRHGGSLTFGVDFLSDAVLEEHLEIVRRHLDTVPPDVADELRMWRARDILRQARRQADLRAALAWIMRGFREDPALLFWYAQSRRSARPGR